MQQTQRAYFGKRRKAGATSCPNAHDNRVMDMAPLRMIDASHGCTPILRQELAAYHGCNAVCLGLTVAACGFKRSRARVHKQGRMVRSEGRAPGQLSNQ